MQTKDAQSDFLALLKASYVVSANYITTLFGIRNPAKFVEGVRDRTQLDIYEGKRFSLTQDSDETVYFMISNIDPACPGLDDMSEPMVLPTGAIVKDPVMIEYQDGYYIMWDCPHLTRRSDDGETYTEQICGQFHKVDLGDDELFGPIFVRCIKCGTTYQVAHKEGR